MNRASIRLAPLLLLAFITPAPAADSYQDWVRAQMQGAQEQVRQYEDWRSAQDRQFSGYLRAQWRAFQVFQGKVRDPNPKPRVIPPAPVVKAPPSQEVRRPYEPPPPPPVLPPPPVIADPVPPPQPEPRPPPLPPTPAPAPVVAPAPRETPVAAPVPAPTPAPAPAPTPAPAPEVKPPAPQIQVQFYGNRVSAPFDPQWRGVRARAINPAGIAGFWDAMSAGNFAPTVEALVQARTQLGLDDWGYVQLWQEAVQAIQPERPAEQNLLLWFFLVKSGLDVRLGYSGDQVFLDVAVKQPVYAASYIKLGGKPYYALLERERGKGPRSFQTYEANYPAPLQALDLKGAAIGFTRSTPVEKTVSFEHQGRKVQVKYLYDGQLVRFMSGFPQLDFELYFGTRASSPAQESLLQALRGHLRGMKDEEAVNFLLAFVQKAFAYKTDEEQFGREKYFFVEEALHYPFSDCEDRSALFSWLVRELLRLKVVGLHYPGHMTTAVALKGVPRGGWTTVDWQGERYVIADPTYINAGVGMAMPSYARQQPLRVIPAL